MNRPVMKRPVFRKAHLVATVPVVTLAVWAASLAVVILASLPGLAVAEHRPDLEISLGGKFANHLLNAGDTAVEFGFMANYFAEPPQPTAGGGDSTGIQVIVYGPPYAGSKTAEELYKDHLAEESENAQLAAFTIASTPCMRGPHNVNKYYTSTLCLSGKYFIRTSKYDYKNRINDTAMIATIIERLGGVQPLTPAEVAFRNTLMDGLGLASKDARSCLDEVMNVAEGESGKDQKMARDIARLHDAASRVHAIQVLAAVPVGPQNFDDFDPKWWDALKEVAPNPTSTPDPQETATDRLIDLLPPPMNTVVNIVRTGSKTMRAIKTHIVDPATHGEIYACYRRQRQLEGSERITEKMGQDALESAAAQVLLDATGASCKYAYNFKTCYEPQLKGFTSPEARHDEFKRLLRPVAVRFEYIYQVEDAKARQQTLIAERWKPVQDILDRLRTRVNACIADRASKAR